MRTEKRILVVDDDDAIRTLVHTVLRRRGLQVDVARNGMEAMERMAGCHYVLVVLDLMMPLMSGYEVLERIAALPVDVRPYVLVLTAGLELRSFDTNYVVGTIHKPFDIALLLDTVRGILRGVPDPRRVDRRPQETDFPDGTLEETN